MLSIVLVFIKKILMFALSATFTITSIGLVVKFLNRAVKISSIENPKFCFVDRIDKKSCKKVS